MANDDPERPGTVNWGSELIDQLEFHWQHAFLPRLDDLTDDEYLWEPVPDCWSIRPVAESTSSGAIGAGGTRVDGTEPEPDPPPVTTIAWRMAHVAIEVFGLRAANQFGARDLVPADMEYPLTADGGRELLSRHHDAWVTGLRDLSPADLARPCGPTEGPWGASPLATLILHINREALHHGAEIMLLRDLYRARLGVPGTNAGATPS